MFFDFSDYLPDHYNVVKAKNLTLLRRGVYGIVPSPRLSKRSPAMTELQDADQQAAQFQRIRDAHRLEVAEDYVEMIADLIEAQGEARAVDLASRFGVTNATVNNTIARLQREGLVHSRPYRSIFLTEEGWSMARASRERHVIVRDFLLAIGVRRSVAEADAEGVEHHVSAETLAAFKRLTRELARTGGSAAADRGAPRPAAAE